MYVYLFIHIYSTAWDDKDFRMKVFMLQTHSLYSLRSVRWSEYFLLPLTDASPPLALDRCFRFIERRVSGRILPSPPADPLPLPAPLPGSLPPFPAPSTPLLPVLPQPPLLPVLFAPRRTPRRNPRRRGERERRRTISSQLKTERNRWENRVKTGVPQKDASESHVKWRGDVTWRV